MHAVHHSDDETLLQPLQAALVHTFAERRVALPSGAQVAVRVCGVQSDAPAVVLLHGISSGAASWLQPALQLGRHHHVLAWDAPGYGASTPLPDAAPRDADYADRLEHMLAAMDIGRCVLVAHSLGALMACAHARGPGRHRVARLVLISPAGGYGGAGQAAASERVRSERGAALASLGVAGIAARIPDRLLSPAASATARAWVRWNAARLQAPGYLQAVELLCGSDLGAAPHPAAPVEVFCGAADVVTPPDACRGWAASFGAPFHLIADAGHASPAEQPDAVAALIAGALRRTTPHGGDTHA